MFQNFCMREFVDRNTDAHAGLTCPVWKNSHRCTAARPATEAGKRCDSGCFSAAYQLIAFDSHSRRSPSVKAGTFPTGLIAMYGGERFSPLGV